MRVVHAREISFSHRRQLCRAGAILCARGSRLLFSPASAPQDLQSISTIIRAIANLQDVTMDNQKKSLTVHAAPSSSRWPNG